MAVGANNFLQDVLGAFSPDKRLGVLVVMNDVAIDGINQSRNTVEDTSPQLVGGDIA